MLELINIVFEERTPEEVYKVLEENFSNMKGNVPTYDEGKGIEYKSVLHRIRDCLNTDYYNGRKGLLSVLGEFFDMLFCDTDFYPEWHYDLTEFKGAIIMSVAWLEEY